MAGKIVCKELDSEQKCPECNWLTPVLFSVDNREWLCGNCLCGKLVNGCYIVEKGEDVVIT